MNSKIYVGIALIIFFLIVVSIFVVGFFIQNPTPENKKTLVLKDTIVTVNKTINTNTQTNTNSNQNTQTNTNPPIRRTSAS